MDIQKLDEEIIILNNAIANQDLILEQMQQDYRQLEQRTLWLKDVFSNENLRKQVMEADKRVLIVRKQNILDAQQEDDANAQAHSETSKK
jgi:hypothetical protein